MQTIPLRSRITWKQPAAFAIATAVSTVLAIYAVVFPAGDAPVPGVSGLYIAAAVYVPLALWFGIWGCLAGYVSCFILALYSGYALPLALVWSLADFFEGFVPLIVYRSIKIKPELHLKKPKITYAINVLLAAVFVVSAYALINALTSIFIGTFIASIVLLILQAAVEDRKTWITWLVVGVFVASIMSGIFGAGALALFGAFPMEIFPTVFYGWIFGDIIVLATIGTIMTVVLTPFIVKSGSYVRKYFS
ncbi:MAG: hypothetical protein NWF01_09110 [Candidatus Bathyarchaeota archaeon]|nr:hypothetical protein [Candidatus Bathyarchaeota archaeon]